MGIFSIHNPSLFTFGLLGNIVSFVVFLAPVPTFFRICKKKSTEGFQSVPYVVALFSAMLWLYYASLKSNDAFLLITINSIGCLIETVYIALYIVYAPKQARIWTLRILIVLNFGGFCLILLLSHFFAKGNNRVRILGWVCVVFSVCVFAAPLSIMRLVIRTKSVEFMPFGLSFFLTLSAVMWFFYGILSKDFYVAVPNILGCIFGLLQMVLYVIYKNYKPGTVSVSDPKLPVQMQPSDVIKEKSSTERGDQNVEIGHVDNDDDDDDDDDDHRVKNNMDGSNKNQPTRHDV